MTDQELLQSYKETGLEPEEINPTVKGHSEFLAYQEGYEQGKFDQYMEFCDGGIPIDRLRELAQADREGRCVVLPCEVGSTVYMPFCDKVVEMRIGQFHVNGYTRPRIWADIDCDWATTQRVRWDLAFGKTVFLTRAEAEAALRGEQDG